MLPSLDEPVIILWNFVHPRESIVRHWIHAILYFNVCLLQGWKENACGSQLNRKHMSEVCMSKTEHYMSRTKSHFKMHRDAPTHPYVLFSLFIVYMQELLLFFSVSWYVHAGLRVYSDVSSSVRSARRCFELNANIM